MRVASKPLARFYEKKCENRMDLLDTVIVHWIASPTNFLLEMGFQD